MKIIKKHKLPNQLCECCGCEVKLYWTDVQPNILTFKRDIWQCPLCKERNKVKFKDIEQNENKK